MFQLRLPSRYLITACSILVLLFLLQPLSGHAQAVAAMPELLSQAPIACSANTPALDEAGFVAVGGIEVWVTVRGQSCGNPVILMLHGGPGNPLSPYARNIYGDWEKDFTLVQWDQRGAGKTYGRSPATAELPLSMARMAQDGVELAEFLTRHLNQSKLILMGGSWGSALGVHMAKVRPDLFHAYVGTGLLVGYAENQLASYSKLLARARTAGDSKTVGTIEALGPPPWTNPRNFGILRRATRVYEAKVSEPPPKSWWVPEASYTSAKAVADFESSEEFSYLQFVGLKGDGMLSRLDLPALGLDFAIPVYLVQGAEDLVTTAEVAKRYFETIVAPAKDFVLLPRTGHDPNVPMVEAQFKLLKERIRPLVR